MKNEKRGVFVINVIKKYSANKTFITHWWVKSSTSLFLFIMMIFVVMSCSPEDKLIDNTTNNYKLLVVTDKQSPIKNIKFPEGVITDDDLSSVNKELNGKTVDRVKRYLDKLYFIVANEKCIYVFAQQNLSFLAKIDFNQEPKDIVFANATDAYVVYNTIDNGIRVNNTFGLLDIYFNKYVKDIDTKINANIVSLSTFTNNIYVSYDNKLFTRFDSRDFNIKQEMYLRNVCYVSSPTTANEVVLLIDGDETKNIKASVMFIAPEDIKQQKETEVDIRGINSENLKFLSITNSPNDYLFVVSNQAVLQLDLRGSQRMYYISENVYNFSRYLSRTQNLLFINAGNSESKLDFADIEYGELKQSVSVPILVKDLIYIDM